MHEKSRPQGGGKSGRDESAAPGGRLPTSRRVAKAPTGIPGFDEITEGGIPRGRATAIYGNVGSGKTVFALECLVHAAEDNDEPGVFLSFAESEQEIRENARSQGIDLAALEAKGLLVLDSARVDPREISGGGGYSLDGLLVRLEHSIEQIGAKRVALDALNVLTEAIPHPALLRAELRRLLDDLKARGITVIVALETLEEGSPSVAEFLADCVIKLRFSLEKGVATRRLRVIKYRGSPHRMNEYAFLISNQGITVTPVTGVGLDAPSFDERVDFGIAGLDEMLDAGIYKGDAALIVGGAGTGKTTFAVALAAQTCRQGDRCLVFALEESASQIVRNMRSVGFRLEPWQETDLLRIRSGRPGSEGLEPWLAYFMKEIEAFQPQVVVIDPITPLLAMGLPEDVRGTLTRLVGFLKGRGITTALTMLASEGDVVGESIYVTSLVDDIISLRNTEAGGERNRSVTVLKARGIAHSKQVREFELTPQGVTIFDVFAGPGEVAWGTAREAIEAAQRNDDARRLSQVENWRDALNATRRALDARIEQLRAEFAIKEVEAEGAIGRASAIGQRERRERETARDTRDLPQGRADREAEGR